MLPIVIDAGSFTVKAGFGGASSPKLVFESSGLQTEENLYEHTFEQIGVSSEGQKVLITQHLLSNKDSREKTAKIFFEKLKVKQLFIANDSVLALYATGRKQGLVVDIGHNHGYVVPVIEGYAVSASVRKFPINGEALNNFIAKDLKEKGHKSLIVGKLIKQIKEEMCPVASDKSSISASPLKMIVLADEKQAESIELEWYKYAEALFQPSLSGQGGKGIQKLVEECISDFDTDVQKTLWGNILIQSGSTKFLGFAERLQQELNILAPSSMDVNVICANFMNGTWVGGSILVSLSQMDAMNLYITAEEFAEKGAAIVHEKCK